MFRRRPEAAPTLAIRVDGVAVPARAGESVAAAMLAAGLLRFRDAPAGGAPRGPYCMMGACFDCLVTIDGVGNRQACLETVREGMAVETQSGPRALAR
ncbi:MAG: (2Fe-2S)-binding protein [Candidatus Odyssella sp.]|nr:(2Fe-2S)-binding protein [Candidatus Odyssella sp.]